MFTPTLSPSLPSSLPPSPNRLPSTVSGEDLRPMTDHADGKAAILRGVREGGGEAHTIRGPGIKAKTKELAFFSAITFLSPSLHQSLLPHPRHDPHRSH